MYDVVIAGGGPAGLSAALVLGRCRRAVLLCDGGPPRNASSRALHGYLTRDGIPPLDLLRLGREELVPYGIECRAVTVIAIDRISGGFEVTLAGDEKVESRTVLLATGVEDHPPPLPGLDECYGSSVHHCPYCDGWEVRDKVLAVIGRGASAAGLALSLKTWSDDVIVCTNGPSGLKPEQRAQLAGQRIAVRPQRVLRLDHEDGWVRQIVFDGGTPHPCEAVFFSARQSQRCDLPLRLGCEFTRAGTVKTDHLGQTGHPGVFVVGDASRDVQFVIVAAAEGAKAAVAINKALQARTGHALATHGGA
jgi:thioredoxin reductase